jgi:hypothetical protein
MTWPRARIQDAASASRFPASNPSFFFKSEPRPPDFRLHATINFSNYVILIALLEAHENYAPADAIR